MRFAGLALVGIAACNDPPAPVDAGVDTIVVDLFGEPCTQPEFPAIGLCHEGEGACHDETGGSVCRPFCDNGGMSQCAGRGGVETETDRGACVCTPP
jgi:hypothetical protein